MDIKELILSDLESTLDKSRLEPIDRWIINDDGKKINVQIENCIDEQVVYAPLFDKKEDMGLIDFVERYCINAELLTSGLKEHFYDLKSKGKVTENVGGFVFNYNLMSNQMSHNEHRSYSSILEGDFDIMNCKLCGGKEDEFTFYCGNGYNFTIGKAVFTVVYLYGYFSPLNDQCLYSIFNIESPDYVSIKDYGIKYIGDIKKGSPLWMDDDKNLTFDLTIYNDQKNKDFTKGLVALPFMMSSAAISIQSELLIPMRRTEIKDEETRVVYNYLYKL